MLSAAIRGSMVRIGVGFFLGGAMTSVSALAAAAATTATRGAGAEEYMAVRMASVRAWQLGQRLAGFLSRPRSSASSTAGARPGRSDEGASGALVSRAT